MEMKNVKCRKFKLRRGASHLSLQMGVICENVEVIPQKTNVEEKMVYSTNEQINDSFRKRQKPINHISFSNKRKDEPIDPNRKITRDINSIFSGFGMRVY